LKKGSGKKRRRRNLRGTPVQKRAKESKRRINAKDTCAEGGRRSRKKKGTETEG